MTSTFAIITHVVHKKNGDELGGYGPYVKEMNLWIKECKKVYIVAPLKYQVLESIDLPYKHSNLHICRVPELDITTFKSATLSLLVLPWVFLTVFFVMLKSSHIHLRCPGNMGLIGCFAQILLPWKKKSAKYAGNWDPNSMQPWSYKLQQAVLRNTFLTRNMQALVYGEWPDKNKNIKSFFTASYSNLYKVPVDVNSKAEELRNIIRIAFVGTLTSNKQPMFCLEVVKLLKRHDVVVNMEFCGDGVLRPELEQFVANNDLTGDVIFHGNISGEKVKEILQRSHFLLFASNSEGWPKAVAEAMWWGCVPITKPVSCVPQMLGNGVRGKLIGGNVDEVLDVLKQFIDNPSVYVEHALNGIEWARQFTVERFENEIKQLI